MEAELPEKPLPTKEVRALEMVRDRFSPYTQTLPSADAGPQRIEECISLTSDAYCHAFVACIKDKYVIKDFENMSEQNHTHKMKPEERSRLSLVMQRNTEKWNLMAQVLIVAICQIVLILIVSENQIFFVDNRANYTPPAGIAVVVVRFICAILLHLTVSDEMSQGLSMMKFAVNHYWMFDSHTSAFSIGFLQFMSVFLVELSNMVVLCSNPDVFEVIMNFLAFVVILDVDNMVAGTQTETLSAKMVEDGSDDVDGFVYCLDFVLKYQITTSRWAENKLSGNRFPKFKTRVEDAEKEEKIKARQAYREHIDPSLELLPEE